MLTEQEKKHLLEKTELCFNSKNWDEAARCYDQLSINEPTNPYYYKCIARIYLCKEDPFSNYCAIIYINTAIWWGPDDSDSHYLSGAIHAQMLNFHRNIGEDEKKKMAAKIIADYEASLKRDPTNESAWLSILERYIVDRNWDDAISVYGECKPYIKTTKDQLVRAWLGCIAKVLYGDAIKEKDRQPLFDDTIRLKGGKGHSWCVTEIENLLMELEHGGDSQEKVGRAKEYHQKFLSHFDGEPSRDNL
jgi:tetratricopeptide (TPR) repeat protein